MQRRGPPIGRNPDGRDEVEAKQRQVDEVVPAQGFIAQVSVDQSKPSETPTPGPQTSEIGQEQLRGITNEDMFDFTPSVDEHPDLPLDAAR